VDFAEVQKNIAALVRNSANDISQSIHWTGQDWATGSGEVSVRSGGVVPADSRDFGEAGNSPAYTLL